MNLEIPDRVPFDGIYPWRSNFFYMILAPARSWQPPSKSELYPQVNSFVTKFRLWKWKPQDWNPPKDWKQLPRTQIDEFGCLWEYKSDDPTKGHPTGQPLHDWDLLENWEFPDPYDPSHYGFGKIGKLLSFKYRVGILDSFLFSRFQYLRGFSQALMDLIQYPDEVNRLLDRLTEYFLGTVEMWQKYGADAVLTMDDMGIQDRLFISPQMYQNFFLPRVKKIVQRTHELGMKFILHSCGHVNKLIPLWIDAGVDALQFDSPHMTGLDFDKQFIGQIGFHLVPDIQKIYPKASLSELENEIKRMIRVMGAEGGLLIKDYEEAAKILDVPIENVKNLPKFVKKWGQYPLDWI